MTDHHENSTMPSESPSDSPLASQGDDITKEDPASGSSHGRFKALSTLRMPIKLQLSVAVASLLLLTVVAFSTVLIARHRDQLYQQTFLTGEISLNYFAGSALLPLANNDVLGLNKMLAETKNVEGLVYAVVVDDKDIVTAHTDPSLIGTPLGEFANKEETETKKDLVFFEHVQADGRSVLHLSKDVTFQGKKLGSVAVGLSLEFIQDLVQDESISIAALGAFFTALGIGTAVLLGLQFAKPIQNLVGGTKAVGLGDFDCRIKRRTNDEFKDLADSFNFMAEELTKKLLIQKSFCSYVSQDVLDIILENPDDGRLLGRRGAASILFADLRGFTAYSEKHSPEEVVQNLNEYFEIASACVAARGGYIDKYMGDAVLAVFGVPNESPDHAEQAVVAAVEIQKALLEKAKKGSNPLLSMVGIAITSGDVLSGNIGSSAKMDYTVIGNQVNIASRLNNLANSGEIKISKNVYNATKGIVDAIPLVPVKIKGASEPLAIYLVAGLQKQKFSTSNLQSQV
jgi:adenylate cyclase